VISNILLSSLQQCFSFGFVVGSSLFAELFEGGCDFLRFFLISFEVLLVLVALSFMLA
jgi:hypothetical protein